MTKLRRQPAPRQESPLVLQQALHKIGCRARTPSHGCVSEQRRRAPIPPRTLSRNPGKFPSILLSSFADKQEGQSFDLGFLDRDEQLGRLETRKSSHIDANLPFFPARPLEPASFAPRMGTSPRGTRVAPKGTCGRCAPRLPRPGCAGPGSDRRRKRGAPYPGNAPRRCRARSGFPQAPASRRRRSSRARSPCERLLQAKDPLPPRTPQCPDDRWRTRSRRPRCTRASAGQGWPGHDRA